MPGADQPLTARSSPPTHCTPGILTHLPGCSGMSLQTRGSNVLGRRHEQHHQMRAEIPETFASCGVPHEYSRGAACEQEPCSSCRAQQPCQRARPPWGIPPTQGPLAASHSECPVTRSWTFRGLAGLQWRQAGACSGDHPRVQLPMLWSRHWPPSTSCKDFWALQDVHPCLQCTLLHDDPVHFA